MSCVMKSTDVPVACQILRSSSCITARVWASRAANGSSMSSIFGSLASTRAIWMRCFMPPDSSDGCLAS